MGLNEKSGKSSSWRMKRIIGHVVPSTHLKRTVSLWNRSDDVSGGNEKLVHQRHFGHFASESDSSEREVLEKRRRKGENQTEVIGEEGKRSGRSVDGDVLGESGEESAKGYDASVSRMFREYGSYEEVFDYAHSLIQEGKFEEARSVMFELIGRLESDSVLLRRVYRIVGVCYFRDGKYQSALPWFVRAAKEHWNQSKISMFQSLAEIQQLNQQEEQLLRDSLNPSLIVQSAQDWFNVATCAVQVPCSKLNKEWNNQHKAQSDSNQFNSTIENNTLLEQRKMYLQVGKDAFDNLERIYWINRYRSFPIGKSSEGEPSGESNMISFWIQMYWFIVALSNGEFYQESWKLIKRLTAAYVRVRFTDTEYLDEVGLPPLSEFLTGTISILHKMGYLKRNNGSKGSMEGNALQWNAKDHSTIGRVLLEEQLAQGIDKQGKLAVKIALETYDTSQDNQQ